MAVCESDSEDMIGAEAFAGDVARRASQVLSKLPARSEAFTIGELPFQLVSSAGNSDRSLGRAFLQAPHVQERSGAAPHLMTVWDGTAPDALPPALRWPPSPPEPLATATIRSNDAARCAFEVQTNSLIVYNFVENSSHTWFPSIAELPAWAKAAPFRILLSWLCNRHRIQIVHGAAVAIDGRAVLLAGQGGSGKSTTALACALAGLEYLGDDYCAVEPAAGKVHLVYRSAKLFESSLRLLPSLADLVDNRHEIGVEKGVIFLEPGEVKLARSAQLSAILLPRVGAETCTRLHPATRDEAVKAILPATIGGLMGGTAVTPRLIMELVRSVPAYHLALGTDLKSVTDSVASKLLAA